MNIKRLAVLLIIVTAGLLSSCGYGFLNFSSEVGRIEIEFKFSNVNAKDIDTVELEFSPPWGLSSSADLDVGSDESYYGLDNTDVGSWKISGTMFADDTSVQDFSYDLEVKDGYTSKLYISAYWNGDEYEISFETYEYEMDSDDDSSTAVPTFELDGFTAMPAVYQDYSSGEQTNMANIRVTGSSLENNIDYLKLIFPDGVVYETGYDYSRFVMFSQEIYGDTDETIEIQRYLSSDSDDINGTYRLILSDYENNENFSYTDEVDLDVDSLLPQITTSDLSEIAASCECIIDYDFGSSEDIGTMLVFIIESDSTTFYPASDDMAVSTSSGSFTISPGTLSSGINYQLILATIGHATSQPYTDAITSGLELDMRAGALAESVFDLFGEETGFVFYTVFEFTASS